MRQRGTAPRPVIAEQYDGLDSRPVQEMLGSVAIRRDSSLDLGVSHRDQIRVMSGAFDDDLVKAISVAHAMPRGDLSNLGLGVWLQSRELVGDDAYGPTWWGLRPRLCDDPRQAIFMTRAEWAVRIELRRLGAGSQTVRCRRQCVGAMSPLRRDDDPAP